MRTHLTPQARDDLLEISDYINEQSGPDRAERVIRTIMRAVDRIAERPGIGHKRDDLTNLDVLFKRVYRFLIVYRPDTNPLEVVAIVGGYRDVGALLEQRDD